MDCELCHSPLPKGEEMFTYHGYSGPCPTGIHSPSFPGMSKEAPTPKSVALNMLGELLKLHDYEDRLDAVALVARAWIENDQIRNGKPR